MIKAILTVRRDIGSSAKKREKKATWQNSRTVSGPTTKRDAIGTIVQHRTEKSEKEKAKEKAGKEERKDQEKAAKEVKDENS